MPASPPRIALCLTGDLHHLALDCVASMVEGVATSAPNVDTFCVLRRNTECTTARTFGLALQRLEPLCPVKVELYDAFDEEDAERSSALLTMDHLFDLAGVRTAETEGPTYDVYVHLSVNVHLHAPTPPLELVERHDEATVHHLKRAHGFTGLEYLVFTHASYERWWRPFVKRVVDSPGASEAMVFSFVDASTRHAMPFVGASFERAHTVVCSGGDTDDEGSGAGGDQESGCGGDNTRRSIIRAAAPSALPYRYTHFFEKYHAAHVALRTHFGSIAKQFQDALPPAYDAYTYPDAASPPPATRGIVVCGHYDDFVSVWMQLQALRDAAVAQATAPLPVEWYVVEGELLPFQRAMVREHAPEVTLVPWADRVPSWWPSDDFEADRLATHRDLFRVFALATSAFDEVLWLDAQAHAVGDAVALCESLQRTDVFTAHGVCAWSYPACDVKEQTEAAFPMGPRVLAMMGLPATAMPSKTSFIDIRQLFVDRRRCWHPLCTWLFFTHLQDTVFKAYTASATPMLYVAFAQCHHALVTADEATYAVLTTKDALDARLATAVCDATHQPLFVHRRAPPTVNALDTYTLLYRDDQWTTLPRDAWTLTDAPRLSTSLPALLVQHGMSLRHAYQSLRARYQPAMPELLRGLCASVRTCYKVGTQGTTVRDPARLTRLLAELDVYASNDLRAYVFNGRLLMACHAGDRAEAKRLIAEAAAVDADTPPPVDEWTMALLSQCLSFDDARPLLVCAAPSLQCVYVFESLANGRIRRYADLAPWLEHLGGDEGFAAPLKKALQRILDDHATDALHTLLHHVDAQGVALPRLQRPRYLGWAQGSTHTDTNTREYKQLVSGLHRQLYGLRAAPQPLVTPAEAPSYTDRVAAVKALLAPVLTEACASEDGSAMDAPVDVPADPLDRMYQHLERPTHRRKVGFLSAFFTNHSVARSSVGVIANLNRDLFDVTVYCFHVCKESAYYRKLEASGHRLVVLDDTGLEAAACDPARSTQALVDHWADVLRKAALDVLVYCDLGMHEWSYLLAHQRLAPVQMTTWGHAETSGIDTIDYFVSSALYELPHDEAQTHYSEHLLLHQSLGTYYYDHYYAMYDAACGDGFTLPEALQEPTMSLVFYPHALDKASDHDLRVCAAVLTATAADAHPPAFVFVDAKQDAYHKARLAQALARFANRVYVFPRLPTGHFYQVLRRATLVLDAYPHGGFHTSLEAMYFGKVVVTRPSAYLRGRFTQGFYKGLGMVGPIAADEAALVDRTVGLVRDAEQRGKLETHIQRHAGRLFNEVASVREWEDTLVGVGLV